MALNFANEGMFPNPGVYDDIGKLKERWQQEDSDLVNVTIRADADETVYTVTSGKKLYVGEILFCDYGTFGVGNGGDMSLLDGGAGGSTVTQIRTTGTEGQVTVASFHPPLLFETDVYCLEGDSIDGYLTISGWEEDA